MTINKCRLFDTETTGLIGEIIEVASIEIDNNGEIHYGTLQNHLVRNTRYPIGWGAMGIHGITPEQLTNKPTFEEIKHLYIPPENIYVGSHNWKFDSKMLGVDFQNNNAICTLELAKRLIDKSACEAHTNMSLFYYLGCYKDGMPEGNAHAAGFDIQVTARILSKLMSIFNLTLDDCYDISQNKSIDKPFDINKFICPFNKHKGKLWIEVVTHDREYVEWLLSANKIQNKTDKDIIEKLLNGEIK